MSVNKNNIDNQVVFIISLPRSGSTMLQHILGAHSKMVATAEPWLLFPSAISLKKDVINAIYDHEICRVANNDFLNQLENKEDEYYTGVRKMALHLYGTFLKEKNKSVFIDKTSRYYLILPELFKIFPDAKFIFLARNPLATFSSFLTTMISDFDFLSLGKTSIREDLLNGYRLLYNSYNLNKDKSIFITYEEIITDPKKKINELCNYIGLDFEPEMLQYNSRIGVLQGKLVDPKSIHKHDGPVMKYLDSWKLKIKSDQQKLLATEFVEHLGPELIKQIGYNYDDLLSYVNKDVIKNRRSIKYLQWNDIMTLPIKRSLIQRYKMDFTTRLQEKKIIPLSIFFIKFPFYLINVFLASLRKKTLR